MTQTVASGTSRVRLGPDYWRLWWANVISSTGDGAFVAALPLLAVTNSRDPRLVAVVTAASYLPWMVLSLPAGALVDRYDRATLMWRAQAVQAAVVAAVAVLVVFRVAGIVVLGVAGLLLGSAEVIFSNAAQSVLPALVPPALLAKANGSQQVSLTVGRRPGEPAGDRPARHPALADRRGSDRRGHLRRSRAGPGPGRGRADAGGPGVAVTMWNVVTVSLRQQVVPAHLLGRVNSVYRMLGWGLMPLGALAGGFVAHAAGLRAPSIVAGLLSGLSLLAAIPLLLAARRDSRPR